MIQTALAKTDVALNKIITKMALDTLEKINPNRRKKHDLIVLHIPQNSRFHGAVKWVSKGADEYTCKQLFTGYYALRFRRTRRTKRIEGISATVFVFKEIIRDRRPKNPYGRKQPKNR